MDMIAIQQQLNFTPIDISIEFVFENNQTLFIGDSKKLSLIKASIIGLTLIIPENKTIHDYDSFQFIQCFHYDCAFCEKLEIESLINGSTHIIILNNFTATKENFKNFKQNLYYAKDKLILKHPVINENPSINDFWETN